MKWSRDIVAISNLALFSSRRRHPVSAVIKNVPGQERTRIDPKVVSCPGLRQLFLDRIEESLIEDWLMFTRVMLFLMNDLADIDPVLEQVGERPLGERNAAADATIAPSSCFRVDPSIEQVHDKTGEGFEF